VCGGGYVLGVGVGALVRCWWRATASKLKIGGACGKREIDLKWAKREEKKREKRKGEEKKKISGRKRAEPGLAKQKRISQKRPGLTGMGKRAAVRW
jgi:hypothetical protein